MTKCILLLAAGLGCASIGLPTTAQSATPFIALNTSTRTALASPAGFPEEPDPFIHFCGEHLPTNHPASSERWTLTLNRQAALANELMQLKRRASVVFPLIESILKEHHIPADFKFLPLLESAVTNRAVSRKGAAGFWQLMPGTARTLGLRVSGGYDERFDLRKATHAACRYLNELHDELGSWMLAATAYNAGPNYIGQLSRQYPHLHPMALPYRAAETKAYLFQAMAIKELLTRPQAYRDRLSDRYLTALSNPESEVSPAERATILASFDLNETAFAGPTPNHPPLMPLLTFGGDLPAFVADSAVAVAPLTNEVPIPSDATVPAPEQPAPVGSVATVRLTTRSLSEGPLTEGKLYVFQVVQPMLLHERAFAVGDMIQAHIELIDAKSGQVFLRTDRLTTARTGETVLLNLVATGAPRRPGVALPTRLENWQLAWEAL